MTADRRALPKTLVIACHYPVAAPAAYEREHNRKRLDNEQAVRAWLAEIGPHLYCCGHVHAAWAFQPQSLPNQICLNAGAPLLRDRTGLRLPGFLEILIADGALTVIHHAWTGADWKAVPMLQKLRFWSVDKSPVAEQCEKGQK
jgi:hypothetical protein